jgi:hypothetical protein
MAITVGDVISRALRMANRVDPQHRQRALDATDRAVRYFAERVPWPSLERVETFRSNGTQFFTFPARVRQIISIGDLERQEYVAPGDQWERQHMAHLANRPSQGAWEWQDRGYQAVIQAPSTDTTLRMNTTQSEATSIYIQGLVRDSSASGTSLELVEKDEVLAVNESPVTSANEYAVITAMEKDDISITSDIIVDYARGTISKAARLRSNERSPTYRRIEWLAIPSAGDRFRTRYYASPPKVNDEIQVLDPAIDEDVIFWDIVGDLHWMAEAPQAAQAAWQQRDNLIQSKLIGQEVHGDHLSQAIPFAPMIEDDYWDVFF